MDKKENPATKITYQGYSWGLKISIIEQVENGQISINQAAKKYGVSRSAIQKWMKRFSNLDKKLRAMGGRSPKQEIKELRKKVSNLETERDILESAIDILEDEYGVDVRKKCIPESQRRILSKIKRGLV